jgi:molecular chaperone DnaK (HSP70)
MPGIPLDLLTDSKKSGSNIAKLLKNHTYIGIDFGTSTTIVSYITIDEHGHVSATPIKLNQDGDMGQTITDSIIPSCIAWTGKKVLIGQGAARLKSVDNYKEGKNLWRSFKMRLGIDLGPEFSQSLLKKKNGIGVR